MSIRKLPDYWRSHDDTPREVYAAYEQCADELEAALPQWTQITDDPETWPEEGEVVFGTQRDWPGPLTCRHNATKMIAVGTPHEMRVSSFRVLPDGDPCHITHWKPLCDLDYPPEES